MIDYTLKIILVITLLVTLIIISAKLKNISTFNKNKHIQVLDIININKNSNIVALKIGEEGVLLGVSPSNTNKICDLTYEDILKIENDKNNFYKINIKEDK